MSKKKVAFVTGGSGGIGKSICLKLIKSGFYVAVGYKTNKKAADNLTKKNHAIAIQVDVSSRKSIKKGIQSCKKFFGLNMIRQVEITSHYYTLLNAGLFF